MLSPLIINIIIISNPRFFRNYAYMVNKYMAEDKEYFDVKKLLKTEKYDTKPNMAKFLKTYIKSIRIFICEARVELYPKISYDISKIIIKFKDDQVIIKDRYNLYLCREFEDLKLTENNIKSINTFIDYLEKFHFIRNGKQDVKVFSTDVEKTNNELSA